MNSMNSAALMASKKKPSRERFEELRAAFRVADEAAREEATRQSLRYGSEREARSWASRAEKTRLEKLEAKRSKIGDKIVDYVVSVSPRGEAWRSGAPIFWLYRDLPWEDVIRPAHEPLSVLPPAPYGWSTADVEKHFRPTPVPSRPSEFVEQLTRSNR
jgi:hypothetical protein